MSSDAIMLDSPAQTPDAKGKHSSPTPANIAALPADIIMSIDSQVNGSTAGTAGSWDTKKWRDDVQLFRNKLQHQGYNPSKYRDPLDKPLVPGPQNLPADVEERLRDYYRTKTAALNGQAS